MVDAPVAYEPNNEADFAAASGELNQLLKDQAGGLLEQQPGENETTWKTRQALRIKRGIELSAILRRSNTGPAAAKGAAKRKRTKAEIDSLADLLA